MATAHRYETKRLDCWAKGKELIAKSLQNAWQAKERGKRLGIGIGCGTGALLASFPECEFLDLSYVFAAEAASDPAQSIRWSDAAAERGYLADICYPNLHLWGSMFLNEGVFRTPAQPDFCFQMHACESQGKGVQVVSEHLGIPYFCLDIPLVAPADRKPFHDDYLAHQLHDGISWLEQILGPCDDAKFIAGVKNEAESRVLFGKICELQQAIPAPLDFRALQSLCALRLISGHERETVEFYRVLYDEVQERVRHQVAALATERCRLLHDGPPPFHSLHLFRQVEKYGALFIGGTIEFSASSMEQGADGRWRAARSLAECGITVATREDAVRLNVEAILGSPATCAFLVFPRIEETVQRAVEWRANGVVLHCDRGCQAYPASMPEIRLALMDRGIATMTYESSCGNARELNETQVVGSLESFMEVLGLEPLPS